MRGEHPAYLPCQWRRVQGGLWARGTARGAFARPPMTTPALLAPEDAILGGDSQQRAW